MTREINYKIATYVLLTAFLVSFYYGISPKLPFFKPHTSICETPNVNYYPSKYFGEDELAVTKCINKLEEAGYRIVDIVPIVTSVSSKTYLVRGEK